MDDDSGMDPCECIWGQEMAMRRLISLLRQSQSYCTDTECFQEGPSASVQGPDHNFMLMSLFIAFALIMYFVRPRRQSRGLEYPEKPRNNDSSGAPPTPPPTF